MDPFFKTFGLIALAELGDKSQLLALAFATRYRPLVVLAGIAVVALTLNLVWALAGTLLGDALPARPVKVAAGALFVAFGLWTLREGGGHGDGEPKHAGRHPFVVVTTSFFIAELGDKTMLTTATLASTQSAFLATWLGAALGMTAADAVAIAAGVWAKTRLPERPLRLAAAALFLGFGAWSIVTGALG